MISEDLLEILRCPACVRDKQGLLTLHRDTWLICQEPECGRKYPIKDDIPIMLIDESQVVDDDEFQRVLAKAKAESKPRD